MKHADPNDTKVDMVAEAVSAVEHSGQVASQTMSTRTEPVRASETLHVRELTKHYGAVEAVTRLSFDIGPGKVTGFLGLNGAGKTTTLRMILGLTTPTSGDATFGTHTYGQLRRPQAVVGAVLETGFHPGRTGRDHLRVRAATAGAGHDRVEMLLHQVGLSGAAGRRVGTYSLGMRQRLALAEALLGDPAYLLLDEPANGLDPEGVRWLREFLSGFARSGRTVLVSSHILGEIEATADDVVIIDQGKLLRHTVLSELRLAGGSCRVRAADLDRASVALREAGVSVARHQDGVGPYLEVATNDASRIGYTLFASGVAVLELVPLAYDLEQQFFSMIEAARCQQS